ISSNDVCIDLLGIQHAFVWRFVDRLAGVLIQLRFDVEALQVTDATAKENPNDRFGFGREMWLAIRRTPNRAAGLSPGRSSSKKHGAKSQPCESHPCISKEGTTSNPRATISAT